MRHDIDTVIFDAEGVVVDSESIWDHGQEEFLRRRGQRYDRERTKPLLTGRSLIEGVLVMQEQYGFGGDPEAQAQERIAIIRDLFATEVAFIEGFMDFFKGIPPHIKTCIATAMSEELLALVDHRLELNRLFEGHIFTLNDVGQKAKPNPDLFLHAAATLGSEPIHCLVIEDAPHGIEAARRAGMTSIGLATTYRPDQLMTADLVVSAFSEIDIASFLVKHRSLEAATTG